MSLGILSIALDLLGSGPASLVLLVLGCLAYIGTTASYLAAGRSLWRRLGGETSDPRAAFGHFTFPAASNVLASRLALAHLAAPAMALVGVGAAAWLVLIVAVPLRLGAAKPPLSTLTGSAFLAVVATQSVSVATSILFGTTPGALVVAGVLWCLGILLYALILTLLARRYLSLPVGADDIDPSLGLTMGALAISTLAALMLYQALDANRLGTLAHPVLSAAAVTWSTGGVFIALLTAAWGAKAVRTGLRLVYRVSEWSVVFPLGMFGVAGLLLGRASGWRLPLTVADPSVAASLVSLLTVSLLALVLLLRSRAARQS